MRQFEELLYNDSFDELNNMVRWDDMPKIKDETVGHHTFIVSWITRILAENIFKDCKPQLLATTYAIFHDFNEYITGDVSHNVKYNTFNGTEIRKGLNDYIEVVVDQQYPVEGTKTDRLLNAMLKDQIPIYIKKLVKVADWMSMLMYLKKEENLGNKYAKKRQDYCIKEMHKAAEVAIQELELQTEFEVDCSFLKH